MIPREKPSSDDGREGVVLLLLWAQGHGTSARHPAPLCQPPPAPSPWLSLLQCHQGEVLLPLHQAGAPQPCPDPKAPSLPEKRQTAHQHSAAPSCQPQAVVHCAEIPPTATERLGDQEQKALKGNKPTASQSPPPIHPAQGSQSDAEITQW